MRPVRLSGKQRRAKYNNVPVVIDGYRFDSKREGRCYTWLKGLKKEGVVQYCLRQVPIHLAPACAHKSTATTLRVDFQVFYADGRVRYIDAKGKATKAWLDKAAIAEDQYGIQIEVW